MSLAGQKEKMISLETLRPEEGEPQLREVVLAFPWPFA